MTAARCDLDRGCNVCRAGRRAEQHPVRHDHRRPPAGAQQPQDVKTVVAPSGQRISLDPEGGDVIELQEQGFYELHGQSATGEPAATVAANVDLAESDLTPMDPKEVVVAVSGLNATGVPGSGTAEMSDATREATQRVWWYLLFAGAILLAAETLVSNRLAM